MKASVNRRRRSGTHRHLLRQVAQEDKQSHSYTVPCRYSVTQTEAEHPPLSDGGALDSSSALSSGMASCTGMISGCRLRSWMTVGGAFRTGLATTVDGAGCGGLTTSITWGRIHNGSKRSLLLPTCWFSISAVDDVTVQVNAVCRSQLEVG